MLKRRKLQKPSHLLSKVNEETAVTSITILPLKMIRLVSFKMSHVISICHETFCHLLFRSSAASRGGIWEERCWCAASGLR